jgi:hypothetical protein
MIGMHALWSLRRRCPARSAIFAAVLLVPETNVGGYINTGWDLVANLAGCIFAAVLIRGGVLGPK